MEEFIRGLAQLLMIYTIVAFVILIFLIIVIAQLFKKAGKPGWIAVIPIYNLYTLFEIIWKNTWIGLILTLILTIAPFNIINEDLGAFIGLLIYIISMDKLSKSFGKNTGFSIGLIFLPVIYLSILAFGSSKYIYNIDEPENMPPQNNISNQTFNNQINNYNNQQQPYSNMPKNQNINMPTQTINSVNTTSPRTTFNNPSTSICTNCGTQLSANTVYCPNCGTPKSN